MIVIPKAKINLGLRITGKRQDGFHDIETVFYPVALNDAIEFVIAPQSANKDTLEVSGIDTGSKNEDNLVLKTIRKLREKHIFPFLVLYLHKVIPVGAGLGGGSSDAACLLMILNRYFGLSIGLNDLKSIALELGSDCPFFIDGVPAFATGRGEVFTPVKQVLSGYYLVLLNPGVGINTREAYQNCVPEKPAVSLLDLIYYPITEWRAHIYNDFEEYAFMKHPLIGDLKKELYHSGAIFSLMSGSGSSVFGIFSEKPKLPDRIREFVIWEGKL